MRIVAVIPAGGKGTRSGFNVPKQYLKINGKELIAYTLEVFQKNRSVDEIIISADPFFILNSLIKSKRNIPFRNCLGSLRLGRKAGLCL